MKAALPVSQENRDGGHLVIGDDKVRIVISVHIGDRNVIGLGAGDKGRAGGFAELALPVAEKHTHCAGISVGDENVAVAVVINVGNRDPAGALANPDRQLVKLRRSRSIAGNRGCTGNMSATPSSFMGKSPGRQRTSPQAFAFESEAR